MGYVKHHSIAITTFDKDLILSARSNAVQIFGESSVTEIILSKINMYFTIFIAPDGSKEGWEESDKGDSDRNQMIKWIESMKHEDDSNSIDYCEFSYGSDLDKRSEIINHN